MWQRASSGSGGGGGSDTCLQYNSPNKGTLTLSEFSFIRTAFVKSGNFIAYAYTQDDGANYTYFANNPTYMQITSVSANTITITATYGLEYMVVTGN